MNIIEAIKIMMQSTKLFDQDDLLELRRIYIKTFVKTRSKDGIVENEFTLFRRELRFIHEKWNEFKLATQETLIGENV